MKFIMCLQHTSGDPLIMEAIRDANREPELADEGKARGTIAIIEEEVGLILYSVMSENADVDIIAHNWLHESR